MKLNEFKDIKEFANKALDLIVKKEVENNLMVSNIVRGLEGADTTNWFMCTIVDNNGGIAGVALMTPPFNLTLYIEAGFAKEAVMHELIKGLIEQKIQIPGIITKEDTALLFMDKYCEITGASYQKTLGLRLYQLNKVNNIPKAPGKIRLADERDIFFLPHWQNAFMVDCDIHKQTIAESYERSKSLIQNKVLYIWEDGYPVSQAAKGRKTLNGAIVNAVYTPPYFRGKGYATSCVAEVSRLILESGCKYSSLFADSANPISNSIYQKIGYEFIGNLLELKIEDNNI